MFTVKVRLYRSHDYDLIVLAQTGIISVASIARKALEACFKGEEYKVDITGVVRPIPEKIGNSLSTRVQISDESCPGIESWFRGFATGARNNMVKCLIRKALSDVPVWAYRVDGWVSAEAEAKEVQKVLESISGNADKKAEKPKREATKKISEKKPVTADSLKKEVPSKQLDDIEDLNEEKKVPMPEISVNSDIHGQEFNETADTDDAEDEDFDAFEAFSALQK